MISLNKLDGGKFTLNCKLIETVEMNPDTVICLTNGKKLMVKQTEEEVRDRVIEYYRKIHSNL